ncbi:MAG: ATP-binding protein, partial [Scytonema sp. PMC 1069.18]|nr:ATP-binding protein [Scytonema sp. PMC 1069.18]
MPVDRIGLSPQLLAKIFPFHIAFNRKTEIIQVGNVLKQKYPRISIGSQLATHFQMTRPQMSLEFDAIYKRLNSIFLLQYLHNPMQLKGQIVYIEESESMLFLGSPWVTDLTQLQQLGLQLKDFAIHDPLVDYLVLLQTQNMALADTKQFAEKLSVQRAEIHRALEKEKELSKLKSRIITTISHEFRTPLTKILGSAEILEHYSHNLSREKKCIYFERIKDSVQHLTEMLNEVLLLGKAEAGTLELNPVLVDLLKLCQNLVDELQSTKGNQHIIQFNSYGNFTQVWLDGNLLQQILSHLLLNAIKYSSPGSIIRLELMIFTQEAVFKIEDSGIGISPEDIEHIFEPFYRGKNAENINGTGLGLTIVKKLLSLYQGNISVKSEIGAGTIFTIKIPLQSK